MSYEIDRDPTEEPSLREMTEKAIKILEDATANSDKGFFLMIEGSRIGKQKKNNITVFKWFIYLFIFFF